MKKIFSILIIIFSVSIVMCNAQTITDTIDFNPDYSEPLVIMPNAFTPNGDGINDYFYPFISYNYPIVSYELRIYGLNVQEVFYSTDPFTRWGGDKSDMETIHNNTKTFVYYLNVLFSDGARKRLRGSFLLLL
ncbi:MAG: gliding motility-associated C-terminal domain-containing protein [Bacteroidales bacterium]|nr:gliding motility-associated C-terminal domain-containing protein [Bacteroidales bacterium]